jgi:tetratricopeptide (TPR) repeat protein
MRTKPYIISALAVSLLSVELSGVELSGVVSVEASSRVMAQTETLPPPEIRSTPLPSPDPPPLLPAQEATIKQLVEREIRQSQQIADRVDQEVNETFAFTLNLLNLLITMLIAIPIGTGFVLWWLRQSVIDRLVSDVQRQFQQETEQLIKQQLEAEVTARLQSQIDTFEQELDQLRADFEQRLKGLYQDAEKDKNKVVQELGQILAAVGQDETVPASVGHRLHELTDQLKSLKTGSPNLAFSVSDCLKAADAFYLGRQYDEAIAGYQEALSLEPDSAAAWRGLAKTLRRMGRPTDAITANEELIQRHPQDAWGWFGKGYALSDLHQYQEALQAYEAAIQFEPNRSTFWKQKGYVLTKLQRYDEALDCLDKALRIKPDSAGAYYTKAQCYAAQFQVELAIDHLKEATRRRPSLREVLKTDPDFEGIRRTELFQRLFVTTY